MSRESPQRSVEELLASGPPNEWYAGYGRTDIGITGVNYSSIFNTLEDGRVRNPMEDWSHYEMSVRLGVARATRRIQQILDSATTEVSKLTGFSPEEILDKKNALSQAFQGQVTAPFEIYLVEPLTVPSSQPPLEWFMAFANHQRGIVGVNYSENLYALGKGEVVRQMSTWSHYMGNPIGERDNEERKQRFQEATLYAEHYVKSVTGYYPAEIQDRRHELKERYRGENEAPFEIEFMDI